MLSSQKIAQERRPDSRAEKRSDNLIRAFLFRKFRQLFVQATERKPGYTHCRRARRSAQCKAQWIIIWRRTKVRDSVSRLGTVAVEKIRFPNISGESECRARYYSAKLRGRAETRHFFSSYPNFFPHAQFSEQITTGKFR